MHIEYFLSYVCIYVHYVLVLGSEACLEGLFTPYCVSRWGSGAKTDEGPGVCTGAGGCKAGVGEAGVADALPQESGQGWTWRTG